MKVNFHTHTARCNHALGTDEDYVLAAIEGGYDVLGFSDHIPWDYKSDYHGRSRMSLDDVEDYASSIKALKDRYRDRIAIRLGFECEYFPEYLDQVTALKDKYDIEYFIFGNHYHKSDEVSRFYGASCNDEELKRYVSDLKEGMATGIFAYIAHPDLFMRARRVFDDKCRDTSIEICKWAKENDIILEYNLEGLRKGFGYPDGDFWKVAASFKNRVIIGVDAHEPSSLSDTSLYNRAKVELEKLGLSPLEDYRGL